MPSRNGLRVVFAGGGTGGHLYPAIAIADELRAREGGASAFVGTPDRLEAAIVPKAGYPLHTIAGRPLARQLSPELLRTLGANLAGTLQSVFLLRRLRPDLVIATGGYVCFPFVLAARILRGLRMCRAPIVLLEPNAAPGLTNRLLAPLVDEVWGAFADGDPRFSGKYVHTGVPVRGALRALPPRDRATAHFGLDADRKTLLAMGGSQGARSINDALIGLVQRNGLPPGWQLVCVTGEREYARVRAAMEGPTIVVRPYLDDPSEGYAAADLVLARAGASTLGELVSVGKPAILVPYPFAADDHQAVNARRFAATGAAVVVADREVEAGSLQPVLAETVVPQRLEALRTAAEGLRAGGDPLATIIARVDRLTARKKQP
ncbi:MAG: UDP-N-acetylglucosamine--N-acetylmuramyl-(pentapeptide) pyrophosphoryl-undecaprenol N-acetylglucosamine transferase [Candidatus Tumulicola sp.]